MITLTDHLLHLDEHALAEATKHPFLQAASTSSLPVDRLKAWLAQDRLYASAYVNFIGAMLANIPVSKSSDRQETLEWRITDCLIDCLANIRVELKMFEDTAKLEGWLDDIAHSDLEASVQTRAYQDLFAGATAHGRPTIVPLVVLWATEESYLRAWRYARSHLDQSRQAKDMDVMQRTFIPNWSSPEFEQFVKNIRGLVDEAGGRIISGSKEWKECEQAYRQVLWAEREFWPSMD
ncbi:heme oxygenase-like protein [Polychaeton citri CBS 116435]|uniref:Heme oxygenase-like protein n=1 Tax=Polychaeton citri CBS 116435 TaxID=1314669 RepID=A0A9P4UN51_9PEZI|nr:heme oxygenase-like protein [Polychaeton citri CBS 116435]